MWGSKHAINHARDHSVDDGLDLIARWQAGMYSPDDMLETLRAKREGRAPRFEDLQPGP